MGTSAGTQVPSNPGGTAGAGTGTAAAGQGTPGAGAGAGGGSAVAIDQEQLSPILKGKSASELNELVDTMVRVIAERKQPPAGEAPPPPPKPEPEPNYNELMDPASPNYNPRAAVLDMVQRNFGGVIADISSRANEGVMMQFRDAYPDFKEYEGDIRKLLSEQRIVNPSPQQINGLYLAAKGWKVTRDEIQARERLRTQPPSPPKNDDVPIEEPLEPGEEEVARVTFRNEPDPIKAYRDYVKRMDSGDTTMKVPLSGGKRR